MRSLLFILFVVLSISNSKAQNCSYEKDKTDAFSGKRFRLTQTQIGGAVMILSREGDKYAFSVRIIFGGAIDDSIRRKDTLLIKLADGKVLKISPINSTAATFNMNRIITTEITVNYNTSEQIFKELSASPITDFRFVMGALERSIEVKSKHGNKVQKAATCLLN